MPLVSNMIGNLNEISSIQHVQEQCMIYIYSRLESKHNLCKVFPKRPINTESDRNSRNLSKSIALLNKYMITSSTLQKTHLFLKKRCDDVASRGAFFISSFVPLPCHYVWNILVIKLT